MKKPSKPIQHTTQLTIMLLLSIKEKKRLIKLSNGIKKLLKSTPGIVMPLITLQISIEIKISMKKL